MTTSHSIQNILKNTRQFFRENKLRFTLQREIIIREIFKEDGHFDVEELQERIKNKGKKENGYSKVSRATLYRTLEILIELKYLKLIQLQENKKIYEHILDHDHHDHLICLKCRKIIEFSNSEIEKLQNEICARHHFKIQDHILEIYGICQNCQESQNTQNY